MRGRLFAVAFIFIIFGFGIGGLQAAHTDAALEGGASNTNNETVAVDEGNVSTLTESNDDALVYAEEDDVTVEQSGQEFVAQGNWSWNQHNGTIRWLSGSDLTDGGDASVKYMFAEPTGEQTVTKDLSLIPLGILVDEWLFLGGLILVFGAAAIAARNA